MSEQIFGMISLSRFCSRGLEQNSNRELCDYPGESSTWWGLAANFTSRHWQPISQVGIGSQFHKSADGSVENLFVVIWKVVSHFLYEFWKIKLKTSEAEEGHFWRLRLQAKMPPSHPCHGQGHMPLDHQLLWPASAVPLLIRLISDKYISNNKKKSHSSRKIFLPYQMKKPHRKKEKTHRNYNTFPGVVTYSWPMMLSSLIFHGGSRFLLLAVKECLQDLESWPLTYPLGWWVALTPLIIEGYEVFIICSFFRISTEM